MLADQVMMNVCLNEDVKRRKRLTHMQRQGVWYLKSTQKATFLPPNSFFVQFLKFYHLGIFLY